MARRQSADPLEFYETPAWCTRALIHHAPILADEQIVEPMAGANAMTNVLREAGCRVLSFDINPREDSIVPADTMQPDFWTRWKATEGLRTSVVTNPAFSHVAGLWRLTQDFRRVVLLARITWLEKTNDRADVADPVRVIILPRPSFDGKGADSTTAAWLCWGDFEPGLIRLSREECRRFETDPIRRRSAVRVDPSPGLLDVPGADQKDHARRTGDVFADSEGR